MTTLDVMGYSQDQLNTVPFLVLVKAMEDVQSNANEVNTRILHQVEDTCINMLKLNKNFRKQVAEAIVAFCYPSEKTSTRTQDVVKSIKVLAAQFICFLKLAQKQKSIAFEEVEKSVAEHFLKATKRFELKNRFVFAAIEEQLRRGQKESIAEQFVNDIENMLLNGKDKFVEEVFARRAAEIEAAAKPEDGGKYDKYVGEAVAMAKKLGYEKEIADLDMGNGALEEEMK